MSFFVVIICLSWSLGFAASMTSSAEGIAKTAEAITVRIEGPTLGSGVLVSRDANRYTVLTAGHVVNDLVAGEELGIYTSDGQMHNIEPGSLKRIDGVDLAILAFKDSKPYDVASIGDIDSVAMGSQVFVAGFPLPTPAVNVRLLRFLRGDVIANAKVVINNGYQLLYSNPTLPGMSGGSVLNNHAQLVGIHGQGETDVAMSEQEGVAIKTGTNQAVPISYYTIWSSGNQPSSAKKEPVIAATADDYLAQAKDLLGKPGNEKEVLKLADKVLAKTKNSEAYLYTAFAKGGLGDKQGAISSYSLAIAANPKNFDAWYNRGTVKADSGDSQGAISDYNQALFINPSYEKAYLYRGNAKSDIGDLLGAVSDYNVALTLNPRFDQALIERGRVRLIQGSPQQAISDFNEALLINPRNAQALSQRGLARRATGDQSGSCNDLLEAVSLEPTGKRGSKRRSNFVQPKDLETCVNHRSL